MIFDKLFVSIYKKAMFTRHDDTGSIFYFDYTDFEGLNKEPYPFTSKTGARLDGAFYYYDNPNPEKLVVFDHGMGVGHRPYMREIETICKAGFLVYSYDHEGTRNSEGATIRGLSGSLVDLDCCLDALKSSPYYEGREITVIGHSWGGLSTKNIVALHPEVSKIVALAGLSSIEITLERMVPNLFKSARKAILAYEESINPGYTGFSAAETLKNSNVKAIICQSADDPIVVAEDHHYPLMEALKDKENIRFITVEGRGHNPNMTPKAVKALNAFFAEKKQLEKKRKLRTPEEKQALIEKHDFWKMTEQDMNLWNEIFAFINE